MTVAMERVEAGAALLDEKRPGWRDVIDTETLDISHATHCVLGQVFGHYTTGTEELELSTIDQRIDFGFSDFEDDGIVLTTAWLEVLAR